MQQDQPFTPEYVPGSLVRAHRRQKTGEIPVEEIATGRLNPMPVWAAQTVRAHAVQLPMRRLMLPGKRQDLEKDPLPIGPDGRSFLVARSELSTLDIIKIIVKQFFLATHTYPEIIELDGARWEKTGIFVQFFYPKPELAIPLRCAASDTYDVVVRGKEHKNAH